MAVMDEFRKERESLKNADLKTKWQYFLDYYKWHVVVGAAIIAFAISMIYHAVTAKDTALSGFFLNTLTDDLQAEATLTEFAETADIDLNKYQILLDSSLTYTPEAVTENTYTSIQKIMASIAAAEVDFLAANEEAFEYYYSSDTFYDLRDIYTEEELEKFKDYLYYVDMDVIREKEEIVENGDIENYEVPVYDHFAPDEMGDPVPIGLCIEESPQLTDSYFFLVGKMPLGIVANTKRLDTTKQFIDYLFEGLVE